MKFDKGEMMLCLILDTINKNLVEPNLQVCTVRTTLDVETKLCLLNSEFKNRQRRLVTRNVIYVANNVAKYYLDNLLRSALKAT